MKLTFGIHRNTELSELDTNYKNWLLKQTFFKNRYPREYDFLKNFKPLKRKINFTDLPCDIKSLIYSINYNSDPKKLQYEEDKRNGIEKHGKKGRKQITKSICRWSGREDTHTAYLNCAECGGWLSRNGGGCYNQQVYECCPGCYEQFKRDAIKRKQQEKQIQTNFCLLDTDSEDED